MHRQNFDFGNEKESPPYKCIFNPKDEYIDVGNELEDYPLNALDAIDDTQYAPAEVANVELAMKIRQLEQLFERKNRYYFALEKAEQAVRYLQGYLKDFTITCKRELYPNKIRIVIDIEPYDELNSVEKLKEHIKLEIKRVFPDADDAKIESIAERIISCPTKDGFRF